MGRLIVEPLVISADITSIEQLMLKERTKKMKAKKMNVFELTNSLFNAEKVIIHVWRHDKYGYEVCQHITKENTAEKEFATADTYELKNCDVLFFSAIKKGVIEIWSTDETYN